MASDLKADMTETELLHFYVEMRLQNGDRNVPVEQILTGFPEYLRQRKVMRGMIREADADIAKGRSAPLDLEQAIDEVVSDLAGEGIAE